MARPARPAIERALVIEAAGQIAREQGCAAHGQARAIAARVIDALRDGAGETDPVALAFDMAQRAASVDPFVRLAWHEEAGAVALLRAEMVERYQNRAPWTVSPEQQAKDRADALSQIEPRLARRYVGHLRSS